MRGPGLTFVLALALSASAAANRAAAALPDPTSSSYCSAVQREMASTTISAQNTLFGSMAEFRHSKPSINPLRIYQVVTYSGRMPIVVSCKLKSAAQLRAAFGVKSAGTQHNCWEVVRLSRDDAIAELRREGNSAAAARAAVFIVDRVEPYITGRSFLADFQAIYRSSDGAIHLNAPGLFQDYDSWVTALLPSALQGQSYCHLPTTAYIKAIATGAMKPGVVVTTDDDAPTTPR